MDEDSAAGIRPGRGEGGAEGGEGRRVGMRVPSGPARDARDDSRGDSRDTVRLRERVSALMDGEAAPGAPGEPWAELAREPEARAAWLRYHQVGDWLRSADLHGAFDEAAFLRRLGERLREEPVRLAPAGMRRVGAPSWCRATPWVGALGVALAGLATVALLGALLPQRAAPWSEPEAVQASLAQGAAWAPGIGASGAATSALRIGLRGTSVALNGRAALRAQPTCVPAARPRGPSRMRAMP